MAKLTDHPSNELVKLLVIANSGFGKTGALASLAEAGFNLYILDFDNGLDILKNALAKNRAALERVDYVTLRDEYNTVGGRIIYKNPPLAFSRAMNTLSNWPDKGSLDKWTGQDVLVIDSLTFLAGAAMRYQLSLASRLNGDARIQDWGAAMDMVESVLGLATSAQAKCNVVVNTHITWHENEDGKILKGYPSAIGQKLLPKIPAYFNTVLQGKVQGIGSAQKREFHTQADQYVDAKIAALAAAKTYPQATGLAEVFKVIRGK